MDQCRAFPTDVTPKKISKGAKVAPPNLLKAFPILHWSSTSGRLNICFVTPGRFLPRRGYVTQPRVEWGEDKGGLGWFSPGKGRWEPNTGWKPMLH